MKNIMTLVLTLTLFPLPLLLAETVDLSWSTVDAGGGKSNGGNFSFHGTFGQHDAGLHTGGETTQPFNSAEYDHTGGFWSIFNVDMAPQITSPLAATVMVGTPFSYKISASGSVPMSFEVQYLPPGLTFDGTTISGTFQHSGLATIKLFADNAAGCDIEYLVVLINSADGSDPHAPKFVSNPVALPSPAIATYDVNFYATGTDSDGDILSYLWEFGDNTTSQDPQPTHVYAAPGTYQVTVTVSDGVRFKMKEFNLIVAPATVVVDRLSLTLDFDQPSKSKLTFDGTCVTPSPLLAGTRAILDIGPGLHRDYVLNSSGEGGNSRDSFSFDGTSTGAPYCISKLDIEMKNAASDNDPNTLLSQLAALGFNANNTPPGGIIIQMPISLKIVPPGVNPANVAAQMVTVPVKYKTTNKKGTGKLDD